MPVHVEIFAARVLNRARGSGRLINGLHCKIATECTAKMPNSIQSESHAETKRDTHLSTATSLAIFS